jgi:hypothetical protein
MTQILRWLARAALAPAALTLACTGPELPVVGPPAPEAVALRQSDLPGGLKQCTGSGPIDGYLQTIRTKDPDSYAQVSDAWTAFKRNGADSAAITSFTQNPTACTGTLGAGQGQSAASFVIRYKDKSGALAAFKRGILDFPTLSADQQTPGLTIGPATGLGNNSWVYDRTISGRAAYVAFWQTGRYDILVFTADMDPKAAAQAVDYVNGRAR